MPAPLFACMLAAALRYNIPERVLPAIWQVEHGRAGSVHSNSDGSFDMGLMQINSLWIKPLAQIVHMSPTQTAARLVSDNCFNLAASALILRSFLNETHGNLMEAIGDYHSHTPALNQHYQQRIINEARKLYGGGTR
ncbi:BfpH protein [Neokomagataea thailandica NBRC 106555]|uniref:Lytic transglycosylase n=2 Tax=Neokomagataea TaxID=1223423 RepID=A0A4Y6V5V4_9PROT|nr:MULTISPECIES: lytic transglycosylase domain-containing protein [Neokomagataea]QDH25313.1 lytic transglycosylase [Neokomagataea tanensis]GBR52498.1 BfpH protein [Neokomagataea thailandica NBRC 106555]